MSEAKRSRRNSAQVNDLVNQEVAAACPFENMHGITHKNLPEFLVEPFPVEVDPDDDESQAREMWVVLKLGAQLGDGFFIVYDPLTAGWAVAESHPQGGFVAVVWGETLAEALDGM